MARKARLRSNDRIYHVLLRGKDSQDIFLDDEDKLKMMQILKEKKQDDAFFLYSFCILNNHIHIIIREINDDVSRILKRAATSYAFYFNKKYNMSGRVFQDRFKSESLDSDNLMPAIRFVHRNPENAGLGNMTDYKWSSYQEYAGKALGPTDCIEILDMVSKDTDLAVSEFIRLNNEESCESFLEIAEEKEIDNLNVHEYIENFLKESAMTLEDLKKPESKKVRDTMILYLMDSSNLSKRRIAEILGINRETVRKAGLKF